MLKGDITDPSAKFLLKQQQKCSILVLELSRLALPVRKYSKNCPLANLLCIFFKFLCKNSAQKQSRLKANLDDFCVRLILADKCQIQMPKARKLNKIVQLGPSPSPRPQAWFGAKENTKIS